MSDNHEHTPAENAMLADTYLDVVDGKMTWEEANDYLRTQYPHAPSPSTVDTYLKAAKNCHENIVADADANDVKYRYSKELYKQMKAAMVRRAGAKKPILRKKK
jgi:hypothetical protein